MKMTLTRVKPGHEEIGGLGIVGGMLYQHKKEWRFRLTAPGHNPIRGCAGCRRAAMKGILKAAKEINRGS